MTIAENTEFDKAYDWAYSEREKSKRRIWNILGALSVAVRLENPERVQELLTELEDKYRYINYELPF